MTLPIAFQIVRGPIVGWLLGNFLREAYRVWKQKSPARGRAN